MLVTSGNGGIVKNTIVISLLSGLGVASGLAVDILLAARFGLSGEMDALFVALTIPQLTFAELYYLCNAVLVPSFTAKLAQGDDPAAWDLFSAVLSAMLAVFLPLALLGSVAAPWVVKLVAPGITASSAVHAVRLTRVVLWMLAPAGIIQAGCAMLHAKQRFALPAALNMIQYTVVLVFALAGIGRWGITAVGVGHVSASALQLVAVAGALWRAGGTYRPSWNPWTNAELRRVTRLAGPSLASAGVGEVNLLLERVLASFLPAGTITALGYARRVLRTFSDVFMDSVSTAILPRLSAAAAGSDMAELKKALRFGVRLAILLPLPAIAGLVALDVPTIRLAFQRGAFDAAATSFTAGLTVLYIVGVLPMAIAQVVNRAFFALRNTLTPLYLRLLMLAVNVALDVALLLWMGSHSLPLGLTVARIVMMVAGLWMLRRSIGDLGLGLGEFSAKVGLATAALVVTVTACRWLWDHPGVLNLPSQMLALVTTALLGLGAYVAVARALRIAEAELLVDWVCQRVKTLSQRTRRLAPGGKAR